MEQTDIPAGQRSRGPMASLVRELSTEVRASMEAVREAREAAHQRARRQTLKTRLWFLLGLGATAVALVAFGPSMARWRPNRARTATAAHPSPSAPTAIAAPV